MFENIPFGHTPSTKSKYLFSDDPKQNKMRWDKIPGSWQPTEEDITYVGNKDGYREKEWHKINWDNCIVYIGDSASYGLGIPLNHSIPKLIEKATGIECVNMCIPGASSELMISIICSLMDKVNIKHVIVNHPSWSRMWDPIACTGNLGVWLTPGDPYNERQHAYFKEFMSVPSRQIHKATENLRTIRTLLRSANLVEWTWEEHMQEHFDIQYYKYLYQEADKMARDGWHSNLKVNQDIVNQLLKSLNI
jgi:hypothetical protein